MRHAKNYVFENLAEKIHDNVKSFYFFGICRVFLILLHDIPDFFATCHLQICSILPSSLSQLRNIVLVAVSSNLKISETLFMDLNYDDGLMTKIFPQYFFNLEKIVVQYFSIFPEDLSEFKLLFSEYERSIDLYHLLESFFDKIDRFDDYKQQELRIFIYQFIYWIIVNEMNLSMNKKFVSNSLYNILKLGSKSSRDMILCVIMDQLRYPNRVTKYFSSMVLQYFSQSNDSLKEYITR